MRILVVEDSDRLRQSLVTGLESAGYSVDAVADGARGLIHLRTTEYDVAILDVMLPEMDGFSVLREARAKGVTAAVLMLTAKDAITDRVRGLRSGADDYLVKPFSFDELLARIEALLRRNFRTRDTTIRVADLSVDSAAKLASRRGAELPLTRREYAILEYLAFHAGVVVNRAELEEHIYDARSQVQSNAIDSAISQLRQKLNAGGRPNLIQTRRGLGYILSEPADEVDP
jgi:two-component system response regulator PhoP